MEPMLLSAFLLRLIIALSTLLISDAALRTGIARLRMSPQIQLNSLPIRIYSNNLRLYSSDPQQNIPPTLPSESANILDFLNTVEQLKMRKRTGWHKCGIEYNDSESIADHMYRMGIMAMTIHDPAVDKLKAIKMALVHDMAEAIVGDITPDCGYTEAQKMQMETDAMTHIRQTLGDNPFGAEAEALWKEYTEDQTEVAQFVKDLDKTELIVQVVAYENRYKIGFDSWILRARKKIRHPVLQAIADDALQKRPNPEDFIKIN